MKEMTKEEIANKLRKLRESRSEEDSNRYLRPAMAMCYSMSFYEKKMFKITLVCSDCETYNKDAIKEIIVNEDVLSRIESVYDENTILDIQYYFDGSPLSYKEWSQEELNKKVKQQEETKSNLNQGELTSSFVKDYDEYALSPFAKKEMVEMPLVYKKIKEKIEEKDSIIDQFKRLGMDAKLVYFCESYNYLDKKPCFKIFVKAKDEKKWHESKIRVFGNETDFVPFSDFCMVLNFLESKGLDENLSEIFNNLYNVKFRKEHLIYFEGEEKIPFEKIENLTEEKALKKIEEDIKRIINKKGKQKAYNEFLKEYYEVPFDFSIFINIYYKTAKLLKYGNIYKGFDDNGLIKTKVDIALQNVLGTKIYYTKKEIAQNLKVIFKNEKMEMLLPLALEILKLKKHLDSDFMLVNCKIRYECKYKKYLEDKLKISFGKFCKNIYKFYKKGEVSKTDYKAVLKFLHCLLKENIENKKIKQSDFENYFICNQEKIEKYFIDNNTTFEEYVDACVFFDVMDVRKKYNNFIRKKAVKNNLKNYKQFCLDYISSNDYELSLNEYLKFVEGLKMVFDNEIDDLGDDE